MTERSTPGTERQVVCPFVAFDDDRDHRASVPDHRHRCFAESPAATRALAHQAAYCLASAFPGCPTFIDWARREAAPPKDEPIRTLREAPSAPRQADHSESVSRPSTPQAASTPAPRRRRAEWTAPPPWAPDAAAVARVGTPADETGDASRGEVPSERDVAPGRDEADASPGLGAWSGSALGGLAASGSASDREPARSVQPPADAEREPEPAASEPAAPAFLAGRTPRPDQAAGASFPALDRDLSRGAPRGDPLGRGAVGYSPDDVARPRVPRRGRTDGGRAVGRAPDRTVGRGSERAVVDPAAPSWERPRRFEAYPSLKSRDGGVAALPRPVLYGLIVLIAGIALFATPFLLRGLTGGDGASASPTPAASASAGASAAPSITPVPSPSPTVYTVKAGDVLSRIAVKFGVTVDQIVKANPQIKNPDKLAVGDQLVIPPAVAPAITDGTITPAPSG